MGLHLGKIALSLIGFLVFGTSAAAAQSPTCPPAPSLESSQTSVETKVAADFMTKLLAKLGLDLNVRSTRDSILKDNPRADQAVIVLTMANTLCVMISSDATLSGVEKATRYQQMMLDLLARVSGPTAIARTDGKQSRSEELGPKRGLVAVALDDSTSSGLTTLLTIAAGAAKQSGPDHQMPTETGFLRDPPFYVNDSNKYFVVVASARTESEGKRTLAALKAKAPRYDFVLYAPYGSNAYYGIMMATWVPRSVAMDALRLARRDVAPDAFLWACRSSGQSC